MHGLSPKPLIHLPVIYRRSNEPEWPTEAAGLKRHGSPSPSFHCCMEAAFGSQGLLTVQRKNNPVIGLLAEPKGEPAGITPRQRPVSRCCAPSVLMTVSGKVFAGFIRFCFRDTPSYRKNRSKAAGSPKYRDQPVSPVALCLKAYLAFLACLPAVTLALT